MSETVTDGNSLVKADGLSTDQLKAIGSWEQALAVLRESGVDIRDASQELGDGFVGCEKETLIGKPFVIAHAVLTKGDYEGNFVILRVVSSDGKWIITDGGTGIRQQLEAYMAEGGNPVGMIVRGLRKSEYDNEHGHGTTFYLNV